MDISHLVIQLLVALGCAIIASILVPRQIPGQFVGLLAIGLAGVWLGEWGYQLLYLRYGLNHEILNWQIRSVPIIPAIVGSAIVLYTVTAFLRWGRYSN